MFHDLDQRRSGWSMEALAAQEEAQVAYALRNRAAPSELARSAHPADARRDLAPWTVVTGRVA